VSPACDHVPIPAHGWIRMAALVGWFQWREARRVDRTNRAPDAQGGGL